MVIISSLLEQIKSLDYEAKKQLYEELRREIVAEETRVIIQKFRESAGNPWEGQDAQEYVNELRDHDRI